MGVAQCGGGTVWGWHSVGMAGTGDLLLGESWSDFNLRGLCSVRQRGFYYLSAHT